MKAFEYKYQWQKFMIPFFLREPGLDQEIKNFFYLTIACNFIATMLAVFLPDGYFGENVKTRYFFGGMSLIIPMVLIVVLFDRFSFCQNEYEREIKPVITPLLHSGPVFLFFWLYVQPKLSVILLALSAPLLSYIFTMVGMLMLEFSLHYKIFEFKFTKYCLMAGLVLLFYKMLLLF